MHDRVVLALFVAIIIGSFVNFTNADSYSIKDLNNESTKAGNLREESAVEEEERGAGEVKTFLQKLIPAWGRSTAKEDVVAQSVVRTSSQKSTRAIAGAAETAVTHRSMPKKVLIGVYFAILATLAATGLYFTIKSASP
uniref:RxLR effector protein n=1 Tax=Peronospora matthiolae TaxID=2874970 RepID=A0AAV1TIM4_9STRA